MAAAVVLSLGLLVGPGNAASKDGKATKSAATKSTTKASAKAAPKKATERKTVRRASKAHPLKIPNSQVEPMPWHEIPGWLQDDHAEAYATFLASCKPILRSTEKLRATRGETYSALYEVCGRAMAAMPLDMAGARTFFETNFRPVKLSALGETDGFFTGYYEPVVEGARFPSDIYTTPLYKRPPNLVTQRLRRSGARGKAGKKVVKRASAPYYDRAQIEDGALAGRGLEIVWLKSPIDAFFAEIQGSVRVRLEDGSVIRLNYADKNGHAYFAGGSVLIQRGIVAREDMSMQKIREFMEKNPEEGKALRRMNRSYVFFRETDLSEFEEAIGAQGISLTAARSLAVDRRLHTYGMPVFVNAHLPIASTRPDTWFRRLMIAQDTGGAIVGPARADIYLGAGEEAERAAGRFKHPGQFVMLVPNELDPADSAIGIPLPEPNPKRDPGKVVAAADPKAPVDAKASADEKANAKSDKPEAKPDAAAPAADVPLPASRPAMAVAKPAPVQAAIPAPKPAPNPAAKPVTTSAATPAPKGNAKPASPASTGSANPFPKPTGTAPKPAASPPAADTTASRRNGAAQPRAAKPVP